MSDELGTVRVTARECANVRLPAADFRFDLVDSGMVPVQSSPMHGIYAAASGLPGSVLALEVTPCSARTTSEFIEAVRERLREGVFAARQLGEVMLGGVARLALVATTEDGSSQTVHCAVLVVDPLHAPYGIAVLFSASSDASLTAAVTPTQYLADPRFAPLVRSFTLGVSSTGSMRITPVEFVVAPSPPRPAEIEYADPHGTVRRRVGARETLGRARDNTICLYDTLTSKHHAVIEWDGSGYVVRDLGSVNGTSIDGQPLLGDAPLRHGSVIEIGRAQVRFFEVLDRVPTSVQELRSALRSEGLPTPPLPEALMTRLRSIDSWFYSTEALPARPYHGDLGVNVDGRDYLVVAIGAPEFDMTVLQYCVGVGPLRLALECTCKAPGHDAALLRAALVTCFHGVRALIGAVDATRRRGIWPDDLILDVRALDRVPSRWTPIGGGFSENPPTEELTAPSEVLFDALAWVHRL